MSQEYLETFQIGKTGLPQYLLSVIWSNGVDNQVSIDWKMADDSKL